MQIGICRSARSRRAEMRAGIPPLLLLLALVCVAPGGAASVSWKAVANHGPAISLFRNSHSTAAGCLAEYHGLKKSSESEKTLGATMWVYMQHCECDKPGKPIVWQIAEGLKKLFTAGGRPNTHIEERCRYSTNASERVSFDDYVSAINNDRPVVLTFCYDPASANSLAPAKRRVSDCLSVLGIGYMTYGDQKFLICHDGIDSAEAADRVSAEALGINTQGKPWGQ
jgi:hypothetical protein